MQWQFKICGYVHDGNTAPQNCPLCGAPPSEFEEWIEQKKKNAN